MRYSILLVSMLAAGCTQSKSLDSNSFAGVPNISTISCNGKSTDQCNFINSPVKFDSKVIKLPGRDFPFSVTVEELTFVDAKRAKWVAPVGTFTDGASIPKMFIGIMGHPRSKQFLNAAVVHDAFCATGNEEKAFYHTATWQNVHRMFYDAIRVSGVSAVKAKTMYAALYLGGPRWVGVRRRASIGDKLISPGGSISSSQYGSSLFSSGFNNLDKDMIDYVLEVQSTRSMRIQQSNKPLTSIYSQAKLVQNFKKTMTYIETKNPAIDEVEVYLTWIENGMSGKNTPIKTKKTSRTQEGDGGSDGGSDGGDGGSY